MPTLNRLDKQELLKDGWLPSEIMQLNRAKTPTGKVQRHIDIHSRLWMAVRRSRIRFIADMKRLGWNDLEIKQKIIEYYKKGKNNTVYGFLKSEYKPPKMIQDYDEAVKKKLDYKKRNSYKQARAAITNSLGGFYGQRIGRRMPVRYMHPNMRKRLIVRKVTK